jgi:hypothetical protein
MKMEKIIKKAVDLKIKFNEILLDEKGEGSLEIALKILISTVLGALILAGLYALIGDVVLPQLQQRIIDMFNFQG